MNTDDVARLFQRFEAVYQAKWTKGLQGDAQLRLAAAEWMTALRGLNVAELRRGYRDAMEKYPDWPPTPYQFAKCCVPEPAHVIRRPDRMLERPKRSPEENRKRLADALAKAGNPALQELAERIYSELETPPGR